ncbi:hypothetical protein YC2023_040344 [Brassica napus]
MRTVVAQAAIFLLWRQRNNVLHNQQSIKGVLANKESTSCVASCGHKTTQKWRSNKRCNIAHRICPKVLKCRVVKANKINFRVSINLKREISQPQTRCARKVDPVMNRLSVDPTTPPISTSTIRKSSPSIANTLYF